MLRNTAQNLARNQSRGVADVAVGAAILGAGKLIGAGVAAAGLIVSCACFHKFNWINPELSRAGTNKSTADVAHVPVPDSSTLSDPTTPIESSMNALDECNANSSQGAGTGIGTVFGSLITGVARNPSMRGQLFSYAILGFAFAEATGLFALMVSFLILFAM